MAMEHTFSVLDQVIEGFAHAIEKSCGIDYVNVFRQSTAVKVSNNFRKFGDLQTLCASHIFRHHQALQQRQLERIVNDYDVQLPLDSCTLLEQVGADVDCINLDEKTTSVPLATATAMVVTTVSDYGFVQERRYSSAWELAEAIVQALSESLMNKIVADVHISSSGQAVTIDITTTGHMAWHLSQGHFPCRDCGRFCQGTQGLRTHRVQEHASTTDMARRAAIDTAWQLVVYIPPTTVAVLASPSGSDASNSSTSAADATTIPTESSPSPSLTPEVLLSDGMEAAKQGDIATMRALVAAGWEPKNARDRDRNTPLTWAAGNGHLAACRYLVDECGMDPRSGTGRSKHRRQPIHWSARNGRIDVCAWLIHEQGADVDTPTENGTTPLHLAISQGQMETVQWLVEEGKCDINRCNGFGCNAAHWSGLRGDVPMLIYLQEHGLDYFHENGNGRTALHKGAVKGNREACEWFLRPRAEGGAGMDHRHMRPEQCGDTPMTLAASCGEFELAAYLQAQYDLSLAASLL